MITGVRGAVALILLTGVVCSALPHADSATVTKHGTPSPKDLPWPYGTGVPEAKSSVDASTETPEKESPSDDLTKQSGGDGEEQEEEKEASLEVISKKDFGVESSFSDFTSRDQGKYGYGPGKHMDEGKVEHENEEDENEDDENEEGEEEEGDDEDSLSEEDDNSDGSNSDESGEESDKDDSDEDRDDEDDENAQTTENRKELTRGYYRRTGSGYVPPHFRVATSVTSSVSAVFSSRNSRYHSLRNKIAPNQENKKENNNVRIDDKEDDGEKENDAGIDGEEGGDKDEEQRENGENVGDEHEEDAEEKGNVNEIEKHEEEEKIEQKVERKIPVPHPFFTIVSSSASGKQKPSTEGIYKKNVIKAATEADLAVSELSNEEGREEGKPVSVEEKDKDEEERNTDSEKDEVDLNENDFSDEDEEQDEEDSSSEEDSPAFIVLNNGKQSTTSYGIQNFRLTGSPGEVGDDLLLFLPVVDKSSSSVSRVRALSSRLNKQGKPLDLHPAALGEHIEGYVTNLNHEDTAHFIGELTKVLDDDDSRSNEDDEHDAEGEDIVEEMKEDDGMTFPGQYPEMRKKMTLSPGGTGRTFTVYRRAQNNVPAAQSRGEVPSHFRIPGHRSQGSQGATSKTFIDETEPKGSPNARDENDAEYSNKFNQSEEDIKSLEIKSKPETIIITARPIYPSSEVTEQPKIGLTKEKIKEISQSYSEFLNKYRESRLRNAQTISSSARITNAGTDIQRTENKLHVSQSSTLQRSDSSVENGTPKSSIAILESMQLERAMLEKLLKKISVSESNSSSESFDEPMSESMESFLKQFEVPEPVRINIADSLFDGFSDELEDPNEKVISVPMPTLVDRAEQVSKDSSSPFDFATLAPPSLSVSEKKVMEDFSTEDEVVINSDESLQQKEKSVGAEKNTENVNPMNIQLNEQNIQSSELESPEAGDDNVVLIVPSDNQSAQSIKSQSTKISTELTGTNGNFSKSMIYFPQQISYSESDELSIEDSTDISKEKSKVLSSEVDDAEDHWQLSLESTQHVLNQDSSEEESAARLSLQQYGLPEEESGFPVTELVKSIQGSPHTRTNSIQRQHVQVFRGSANQKQLQSLITQSAEGLLLHSQPHQRETQGRSEQNKSNNFGNRPEVVLTDEQSRQPHLLQIINSEGRGAFSRDGGVVHVNGQLQRVNEGSHQNTFSTGGEDTTIAKDEESVPSVLERPRAIATNKGDSSLTPKHSEMTMTRLQDIKSESSSLPGVLVTSAFQQPKVIEVASDFTEIGDQIDKLQSKHIFENSFLTTDNAESRSKALPSFIQNEVNGLRQRLLSQGKSLSQPSQISIVPRVSTEKSREMIQKEFTAKLREMIEKQSKLAISTGVENKITLTDNLQDFLPEQEIISSSSPLSKSKDASHEMVTEETLLLDSELQLTQTERAEVLSTILPLREQLKRLRERDRLETEQFAHASQSENFGNQQDREKALKSQRDEMQSKFTARLRDMIVNQNKLMLNQSIDQVTDNQRQKTIQTLNSPPVQEPSSSHRGQVDAPNENIQSKASAIPDTMIHVTVAPSELHKEENTTEVSRKFMQKEFTSRLRQMITDQSKVTQTLPSQTKLLSFQQDVNTTGERPDNLLGKEVDPLREQRQRQFTSRPRQMVKNQPRVTESAHTVSSMAFGSRPGEMKFNETHVESVRLSGKAVSEVSSTKHEQESQGQRKRLQSKFTSRLRQMIANQTENGNTRLPSISVAQLPTVNQRHVESQREIMQNEFTARLKQMIVNQTQTNVNQSQILMNVDPNTLGQKSDLSREIMQRQFTDRLRQMVANQTVSEEFRSQVNSNEERTRASTNPRQQNEFKTNQMVTEQTRLAEQFKSEGNSQTKPSVEHTSDGNEEAPSDAQRQLMQKEFTARLRHMVNTVSEKNMRSRLNTTSRGGVTIISSHQTMVESSGESEIVRLVNQRKEENNRGDGMQNKFDESLSKFSDSQMQSQQQDQVQSQQISAMNVDKTKTQLPMPDGRRKDLLDHRQSFGNERRLSHEHDAIDVGKDLKDHSLIDFHARKQSQKHESSNQSQEKLLPTKFLVSITDGQQIETVPARQLSSDVLMSSLSDRDERVPPSQVILPADDELQMERVPGKQLAPERLIPNERLGKGKKTESGLGIDQSHLKTTADEQFLIPTGDTVLPLEREQHQKNVKMSGQRMQIDLNRELGQSVDSPFQHSHQEGTPGRPRELSQSVDSSFQHFHQEAIPGRPRKLGPSVDSSFRHSHPEAIPSKTRELGQSVDSSFRHSHQEVIPGRLRELDQRVDSPFRHSHQEASPGRPRDVHTKGQSGRHGVQSSRNEESESSPTHNIRGRQEMSEFNLAAEQSFGRAIATEDLRPFIEEKFVVKFNNKTPREQHQGGIPNQQIHQRTQSQRHSRPLAGVLNEDGRIHTSGQLSDRQASTEAMQALTGQAIAFPATRSQQIHGARPENGRRSRPQTASVDTPLNETSFGPRTVSKIGTPSSHLGTPKNVPDSILRNNPLAMEQNTQQQIEHHRTQPFRPQNPTITRQQNDFVVTPLNEPSTRTQNAKILRQQNIPTSTQQNLHLPLLQNSLRIGQRPGEHTPLARLHDTPTTRMRNSGQKDVLSFPTGQIRLPEDQFSIGPLVTLDSKVSKARQFTSFRIPGPDPSTDSSKIVRNNPTSSSSVPQVFTRSENNHARSIDNSRKLLNIRQEASIDSQIQIQPFQMVTDLINGDIRALNTRLQEDSASQSAISSVSLSRGRISNDNQGLQSLDNVSALPKLEPTLLSVNVQVRSPSGKLYIVPRTFLAEFYEGLDNNPFGDPTIRISQAKSLLEELLQGRHQEPITRTRRSALSKSIEISNKQSVREEQFGSSQFGILVSSSDERFLPLRPEDRHPFEAPLTRPHVVYADDGAYLVQSDGQKILLENAVHVKYH